MVGALVGAARAEPPKSGAPKRPRFRAPAFVCGLVWSTVAMFGWLSGAWELLG